MKKRRKAPLYQMVMAAVVIIGLIILAKITDHSQTIPLDQFEQVKTYEKDLHNELAKYHLENYTMVLLAVMEQESHGFGGDPMQASESVGLLPNTIKNPKQSIQLGVKHFSHVFTYGQQKHVDFPTILQAYNMGIGYIDYVSEHGGKHSESLAKSFSMIQVHRHPNLYNCGGDKSNFRFPYCYGDFSYSTKVEKTLHSINPSVQVNTSNETVKNPF